MAVARQLPTIVLLVLRVLDPVTANNVQCLLALMAGDPSVLPTFLHLEARDEATLPAMFVNGETAHQGQVQ